MLRRLFLALLIACLAAPVAARGAMPCCDDQAASHAATTHAQHHAGETQPGNSGDHDMPAAQTSAHDCTGCASVGPDMPAAEATMMHDEAPADACCDCCVHAAVPAPETPPPRD